ncbi:peptidoglycan-binding protein [Shimazuella sp. AN120528]|uniref:peptidoglycan recognition protein family protein n=1 Tax=Shimazuella soli TaxID=1892854 RepID=UPI001F10226D|nr:N-acetylmuramoyl-L-alanine amidase [Shimazuella soli]MCH5585797.1 peptidoglycan-binding protein [Shimazuella soli]
MEIKQKLIPRSLTGTRPGLYLNPSYITVHETDNTEKGADARAHANLQALGNSRKASWHYTVDEVEIWQSIPDNEVSWACGDGRNGTGNRKSISVEICVNSDGDFEKAKHNAAKLISFLMKKHGISISNVVQHHHWSGKNCPRNIRKSGWQAFLNLVISCSDSSGIPIANTVNKRTVKLTKPYMHGNDIKVIQKVVGAEVDGIFGPKTMNLVTKLQKAHGLSTDGIVGEKTWKVILKRRTLKLTNPPMTGEDVKEVQKKVHAPIDGIYDAKTMNLVTKFQKSYGLSTDGIVGEKTWEAILLG